MVLLVFEGLDGSGKGTQIDLIRKQFPECLVFKYPTKNTPQLNQYLEKKIEIEPKKLFHLFLADIMIEQEKLREAKKNGKLIIIDRYVFSTIAYEIYSFSYEEAKNIVKNMNFIVPDKVILLDIPSNIGMERKKKQKELDRYEENKNYLGKVRKIFLKLSEDRFLTKEWHTLDATKSIKEVNKEILKLLQV